jgi:hypothetical protein
MQSDDEVLHVDAALAREGRHPEGSSEGRERGRTEAGKEGRLIERGQICDLSHKY